jgi:hypothetical protein
MFMKLRRVTLLLVLAGVAVMGLLFWQHDVAKPGHASRAVDLHQPQTSALPPTLALPKTGAPAVSVPPAQISGEDIARWTTEATGGDASRRAAAITALARAPVSEALPILSRVLMNGEPVVDRPLALQSLRDLALNQGDPVSSIRNAIRAAIYHGDDQTLAADAQEALDVIEESLLK